jgi:hypothetical protein
MTDMSPEGRDLARAINGALHNACLMSHDVDFVNAHGISPPLHPTINLESSDPRCDLDFPRVAQRHRHRGTFDYGGDRTRLVCSMFALFIFLPVVLCNSGTQQVRERLLAFDSRIRLRRTVSKDREWGWTTVGETAQQTGACAHADREPGLTSGSSLDSRVGLLLDTMWCPFLLPPLRKVQIERSG